MLTATATPRRVLVVEDDREIAHLVKLHLDEIRCDSDNAGSAAEALALCAQKNYDLLILDRTLPDNDGLEVCKALRQGDRYLPILMLTARASELDRVLGLEMGADDYLTKPFSFPELLARVKALLRRAALAQTTSASASNPVPALAQRTVRGDLVIDPERRQVTRAGQTLELTAKEFDLLAYFARSPGRVYSRAQLLDSVWGHGHDGYEHTVNSHINRLRYKLEYDPARPRYILTVWGVGYKFAESLPPATTH